MGTVQPKNLIVALVVLLLVIAAHMYLGIGLRLKLMGTWNCRQMDNGALTSETFGFFGSRDTLNMSGPEIGVHIFGNYSLWGKTITSTVDHFEKGDQYKKMPSTSRDIVFYAVIDQITGSQLSYLLSMKGWWKKANVQCMKIES